jgi:flagellar biosynthesis protein FlhB
VADQDLDKSETATPYKLAEARKRGQVSKSVDLTVAAVFLVLAAMFYGTADGIIRRELSLCREAFEQLGRTDWSPDATFAWLAGLAGRSLVVVAPLVAALVITAALANFLQSGGVFSFHPVKPDPQRLNPVAGFKRLFSARLLFDTAKSVVKVLVLGTVVCMVIAAAAHSTGSLPYRTPRALLQWLQGHTGTVLFQLALVLLVIGIIDLVYVRREFAKRMRMSKREVKDEHKQREGDPRIRGRLRELRMQLLRQAKSARSLPDADVLITNPTHVAVALAYKHGDMPAPRLLTKGAGEHAARLRRRARKLGIPIVQNPPLARALFRQVDHDGYVPSQLYPDVAKILVWVYAMRQARSSTMASQGVSA